MAIRLLILVILLAGLGYQLMNSGLLENKKQKPQAVVEIPTRVPTPADPYAARLFDGKISYPYVGYLPKDYGKEPTFYPLILFLHGQSSSIDLERLKHFGPIGYGLQQEEFPFIVVAPATDHGWNIHQVKAFLDRIVSMYPIDRDRVYLTGLSMGGHATWSLSIAYPSEFAAIAPVCGAGSPRDARLKLKNVPAWIFHGMLDDIVPVQSGMAMIGALKDEGYEVEYTIYPDAGHDAWTPAYNTPELYTWFLKHDRKSNRERNKTTSQ